MLTNHNVLVRAFENKITQNASDHLNWRICREKSAKMMFVFLHSSLSTAQ